MMRADYSLPEDKFLFACFNQLYKMDSDVFSAWCRILKRVPDSAIWLLRFPAAGETRLRACKHPCQSIHHENRTVCIAHIFCDLYWYAYEYRNELDIAHVFRNVTEKYVQIFV
jgi:hypothetical protein